MSLKDLEAAVDDARRARNEVEAERGKAAREAVAQVHAAYADRMGEASARLAAAEQALRNAIDATASHPLDGKRVFLVREEAVNRWSMKTKPVRYEGIVEVVRQSSEFPANMTWRRPALGGVIIRKLRKDGSPSLQFYDLPMADVSKWTVADAPQTPPVASSPNGLTQHPDTADASSGNGEQAQ